MIEVGGSKCFVADILVITVELNQDKFPRLISSHLNTRLDWLVPPLLPHWETVPKNQNYTSTYEVVLVVMR